MCVMIISSEGGDRKGIRGLSPKLRSKSGRVAAICRCTRLNMSARRSTLWLALAASWQRRNPEYMPVEQQSKSGSGARAPAPAPNQMVAIVAYSLISASMLLVNKTVLRSVPLPALVSVLQFAVSAAFVLLLKASGRVAVDGFEWPKVKPYCVYVCLFAGSIYTNMRALELANVETVIVFRSALPLLVSLLEVA
jgi:hypothetical protein